jgi:SAM-dependent methyltransferase
MKSIDYCACCKSTNIVKFNSTMDSFVIKRMLKKSVKPENLGPCELIHCLDCDYRGSSYRFEREEEAVYYFEYMRDDYLKERNIKHVADFYHNDMTYRKMRQDAAATILKDVVDFQSITSVLDFGGDSGDMIPLELSHAKKYVLDTDNRVSSEDILFITGPDQCDPMDLVMCSHTLEHVSDPYELIVEIKKYIKPGGWFYLEIPHEGDWTPASGHNFHEHINLFSKTALANVMKTHKFNATEVKDILYKSANIGPAIAVVGKLDNV